MRLTERAIRAAAATLLAGPLGSIGDPARAHEVGVAIAGRAGGETPLLRTGPEGGRGITFSG